MSFISFTMEPIRNEGVANCSCHVMAVTDRREELGETLFVNMVRRACKKAFFEPGDTRQQWKGEAAACLVHRDRQ